MQQSIITYNQRHAVPGGDAMGIFNHIPKCGGSTMLRMLLLAFPDCQRFHHYNILNFSRDDLGVSFLAGHDLSGVENWAAQGRRYIFTLLREPLSRVHSIAKFNKYYLPHSACAAYDMDWYLYNTRPNELIAYLGNGDKVLAEENLFEKYVFFGLMEYYLPSVRALAEIIPPLAGLHTKSLNVSAPSTHTVSPLAVEYFYEKNRADVELYEKAVLEFKRRVPDCGKSETAPAHETLTAGSVNKSEARRAFWQELRQAFVENEELHEKSGADIEEYAFSFANSSQQDCNALLNWLEPRLGQRGSYAYWAFYCARRLLLKDKIALFGALLLQQCNKVDPDNQLRVVVECRLDLAQTFAAHGLWMPDNAVCSALEAWVQNLRSDPIWRASALHALGCLRMAEARWQEAAAAFRGAVALNPDDLAMHAALCDAQLQLGQAGMAAAKADAVAALSADVHSEWALRQMTRVLMAYGDVSQAAEFAGQAVAKNPYFIEGWHVLAIANVAHAPAYALQSARNAVKYAPADAPSGYLVCQLLRRQGSLDDALAAVDELLRLWPERGRLHYLAAEILVTQGKTASALERMRKAVELDPQSADLRIQHAALLARMGRVDDAALSANDGIRKFPLEGWPHAQLGIAAEARGQFDAALAHMRRAYELQPQKRSFAAQYARMQRLAGKMKMAEAFCRKALENDRGQGWAWRELCRCAASRGDREQALSFGKMAIGVQADDLEFLTYFHAL